MTGSVAATPRHAVKRSNKSIYLVLGCTVFAAAAQVLLKFGATHPMPAMNPADTSTWMPFVAGAAGKSSVVAGILHVRQERVAADSCAARWSSCRCFTRSSPCLMSGSICSRCTSSTNRSILEGGGDRARDRWRGASRPGEFARMNKTPLSSILLVLLASLIGSFGAVFLKLGRGASQRAASDISSTGSCRGIALFLGSSIPFVMGLKAWRAVGALSDGFGQLYLRVFWSRLFFNEPITRGKIAALGLILAGIVCIGLGAR